MSVLTTVRAVCPVIGLDVPSAVMASPLREHVELVALAQEMAKRIAFDWHDWNALKNIATITGNGTDEAHDLPGDYKRMVKKADLFPSYSPMTRLTHIADANTWLALQVQNINPFVGAWSIIGNQLHILPILPTGATVKFLYMRSTPVQQIIAAPPPSTVTTINWKTNFEIDSDQFALDERLLKLGMIWQWRANKGLPYGEDMSNFEDALSVASGTDKGSTTVAVGVGGNFPNVRTAYPRVLG